MKILLILIFITIGYLSLAQLEDGRYLYSNEDFELIIDIADEGGVIESFYLFHLKSKTIEKGSGEWFRVNPNGIDEDYEGPFEWYQFGTETCNYSFDPESESNVIEFSKNCWEDGSESKFSLVRR